MATTQHNNSVSDERSAKFSMSKLRRSPLTILVHLSVLLIVILWTLPTAGLFISSFRDKDQLALSGWWTSLTASEQNLVARTEGPDKQKQEGDVYVLSGKLLVDGKPADVKAFGFSSREPTQYEPGEKAKMKEGTTLTVTETGEYRMASTEPFTGKRGKRVFYTAVVPPKFGLDNYKEVLTAEGIGRSFINSLTVTIPATVIPILIAAYAAYALSWMKMPGRNLLIAMVVGLLVVPLQMSLIPLLRLYNDIGAFFGVGAKTYLGIWLAHTGFGLPLAIYLLRNYISSLPREIIESAKVDGATDFEVFMRIVLPLSFPALASFGIFQFLWVWNDLLVATVFLGTGEEHMVLTARLREMLGSRGGNWEILTASAFVSIAVPLMVFFTLQRYLVRGLLSGSVK
ncbi:carbohydrate ABC transporter permease [Vibrio sp. ZSDZ34]|jgi:alpha-glucoside transport system permease protein|uniref:Carbohydrate ABC transporter permease n=1 Tax=Vibrio gelatinilyticus TaxID=2893468 RepID=A0A9X1WCN0_9VIBR|nr:carbohydrate ABC transporter permease [Vibrio gelatinilyticus]MCJ2376110.1 carbohydrate ABC transporter permease [Vibrio gelatinilyticus]